MLIRTPISLKGIGAGWSSPLLLRLRPCIQETRRRSELRIQAVWLFGRGDREDRCTARRCSSSRACHLWRPGWSRIPGALLVGSFLPSILAEQSSYGSLGQASCRLDIWNDSGGRACGSPVWCWRWPCSAWTRRFASIAWSLLGIGSFLALAYTKKPGHAASDFAKGADRPPMLCSPQFWISLFSSSMHPSWPCLLVPCFSWGRQQCARRCCWRRSHPQSHLHHRLLHVVCYRAASPDTSRCWYLCLQNLEESAYSFSTWFDLADSSWRLSHTLGRRHLDLGFHCSTWPSPVDLASALADPGLAEPFRSRRYSEVMEQDPPELWWCLELFDLVIRCTIHQHDQRSWQSAASLACLRSPSWHHLIQVEFVMYFEHKQYWRWHRFPAE